MSENSDILMAEKKIILLNYLESITPGKLGKWKDKWSALL